MEEDGYYYHLDSCGEDTNLQLFALRKAHIEWNLLEKDYKECGEETENLKERLVFIVSCLGLSLSQLLGQNAIIAKEKLDRPDTLLACLLNKSSYDKEHKRLLNRNFNVFIQYYDACRHFGKPVWKKIDSLKYEKVQQFMKTTLDIWNAVIKQYREDSIEADDISDILSD